MRILFLIDTLEMGGSELFTIACARALASRGHATAVAYGYDDLQLPRLAASEAVALRLSDRPLAARALCEWTAAVARAVRRQRPDVIHAQTVTAALVSALAAPRTPLLVTVHGIDASHEHAAALILRASRGRITAVSDGARAGIARHRLAPPIELLPPGIDLPALLDAAHEPVDPLPAQRPRFCCVARQHPAKGVDHLIRTFVHVRAALPSAVLVIVGDGEDMAKNLALARRLALTDHITFAGMRLNAAPFLRTADVVVLPSRREGLPVVALEALALERPVVATAVGGTPTIIRDGETGWLVPTDDERALAAAMVRAAQNRSEAKVRARAGRELVESTFTVARMVDRVEALARELATARRPPAAPHAAGARVSTFARRAAGRWNGAGSR